jgi:hypothetical protein
VRVEALKIRGDQASALDEDLDVIQPTACCRVQHSAATAYCDNCDLLVGLEG